MTTNKIVELHKPCPQCSSSDAYCLYDDGHGYCFSCQTYFPKENSNGSTDASEEPTYEYLPIRGLNKTTLKWFDTKSEIERSGNPRSIRFPYPDGSIKVRSYGAKEFWWIGSSKPGLFGLDKFATGSHRAIIITEGELDAATCWQVCKVPSVSVRSASSAHVDCVSVRQQLNSYERIYLAFDADAVGQAAAASVARLFDPNKVYVLKFSNRKDPNDYLQRGEADDLLNLFHNARLYQPANIICSLDEFQHKLESKPKEGVPYPWPSLTKMTYGIRTGEVVLIKAPEKVGKTTLMHTIEYNILKETDSNVAAIYIEESQQRHLQALAGLELKKPVHLPDCDCTQAEVLDAVKRVVGKDERLFLYSHYGSNDPDVIIDTIRFLVSARACRYVLFDHISMACTGIAGEKDERRALEYLATQLEMMVKELDFSLIMVSHVNDLGQTRGSHYLTKLADITISAERNTVAIEDKDRQTIRLSVPFNRFCASSGHCCSLLFDPKEYTLKEEADDGGPALVSETVRVRGNSGVDDWPEVDAPQLHG
jgi:twinkle protein